MKWLEHRERLETMAEKGSIYGLSPQDREAISAAITRIDLLHEEVRELKLKGVRVDVDSSI